MEQGRASQPWAPDNMLGEACGRLALLDLRHLLVQTMINIINWAEKGGSFDGH